MQTMRVLVILLPCFLMLLEIARTLVVKSILLYFTCFHRTDSSFILESPDFVWLQHEPCTLVIGECWIFILESRADLSSPILPAPAYSRPAGISIIHRFLYLSDLSSAQISHRESNDLSNEQIEFPKPFDVIVYQALSITQAMAIAMGGLQDCSASVASTKIFGDEKCIRTFMWSKHC